MSQGLLKWLSGMRFIKETLVLLFLAITTVTVYASDCQKLLLPVLQGQAVTEDLFFARGSTGVFQLGKGRYAKVYRVLWNEPNRPSRVFKVYENPTEIETDLRRLETLRVILKADSETLPSPFEIVGTHQINENTVEIDDVKGASIEYLMHSPEVAEADKQLIRAKFEQALHQLTQRLRLLYRKPFVNKAGMIYLDQKDPNPEKKFMLHPGNIIVTPELKFWIVDPY